jgi:probable rRNA maturation factor
MKQIQFHFETRFPGLKNRTRLKQFIPKLCKKEKRIAGDIAFVFCSDDFLLGINQHYLQHDTYTDIISFDYTESNAPLTGEIYISVDRVRENAFQLGVSSSQELHRVIFHGVLHLCGYKDKLKADKTLMRAKEDFYLREYFGY